MESNPGIKELLGGNSDCPGLFAESKKFDSLSCLFTVKYHETTHEDYCREWFRSCASLYRYMEKFDSLRHKHLLRKLPASYFSTEIYADFAEYVFSRNGEDVVVWQDEFYPHEFPAIFPPQREENWEHCSVTMADNNFIDQLKKNSIKIITTVPVGIEYYYDTENFIEPRGSLKHDCALFTKLYSHEISHVCDRETIIKFYHKWKAQKPRTGLIFEEAEEFFMFCLDNLDKYGVRQVYVFVDGDLAGFAWGVVHSSDMWVGLHLKIDYNYKGLSRFLHRKRAEMFREISHFTIGTGAHEPGITKYKEDLGPTRRVEYTYVLTGDKNKISP